MNNQYQFAKGLQGAPGVGFNLTVDGNYDMVGKRLTNVGNPTSDTDSATKKYVDENSGGGKTSLITVDSNIDMKSQYSITKLKTPSDDNEAATKKYVDDSKVDGSVFLTLDGKRPMTGNLNMNDANIYGLNKTSSGVVINSLVPNITFPNKYVSDIKKEGLNITNYTITFNPSSNFRNYTLCIVFYHWSNRNFALVKKNSQDNQTLSSLTFAKAAGYLSLISNNARKYFTLPNNFDGKKNCFMVDAEC